MKTLQDYSFIRGFNHEPNFFTYTHEQAEKELGYAKRLGLNSCRLFMSLGFWQRDKKVFLDKLQDFVRMAWDKGISTMPILLMPLCSEDREPTWDVESPNKGIPSCFLKENYHIAEEFITDTVTLLKDEPGLLMWDVVNEPIYRNEDLTEEKLQMTIEYLHHFIAFVRKLDPVNALGVGHTLLEDNELGQTAELVDVILYHDYLETRSAIENTCKKALAMSKKYNKPVIDNETACLCRANPYDAVLEIHDRYKLGIYIFKLMIEEGIWETVHGICYADGTVRDPSIVAALLGFYRNRGDSIVLPEVNLEKHADKAIARAEDALKRHAGAEELLEAAEYIANLLESCELVPMAYPPTAKIEAFRRMEKPSIPEIRLYLVSLMHTLESVQAI